MNIKNHFSIKHVFVLLKALKMKICRQIFTAFLSCFFYHHHQMLQYMIYRKIKDTLLYLPYTCLLTLPCRGCMVVYIIIEYRGWYCLFLSSMYESMASRILCTILPLPPPTPSPLVKSLLIVGLSHRPFFLLPPSLFALFHLCTSFPFLSLSYIFICSAPSTSFHFLSLSYIFICPVPYTFLLFLTQS